MELIGGPHLAVTEGEGVISGLRNAKKETYFGQYATAAQAGMGRVGPGRWVAWAGQQAKAGGGEQAGWAESKEKK
jgi:hypothetical protein